MFAVKLDDFFKTICKESHVGLLLINEQGIVLFFNRALVSMLGLAEQSLVVGQEAPVSSCPILKMILSQPRTKTLHENEVNGKRLWATPLKMKNGQQGGRAFLVEDVTEKELLREGLHETIMYKSILEQILENAYEGVVVTDSEGIVIMLNHAYAKYLEIDEQEAIGHHVTEVIDNTRVHLVIESGVPEFGKLQRIGSHKAVVTRLPITMNEKIIAGVGIVHFRELKDMKELLDKLSSLENELALFKEEYGKNRVTRYTIQDIIGNSPPIFDLKRQILKAAASSSTVLILGENGTGKELVAHSIHHLSSRSAKPFVKINCAAIPEEILEAELFGYVGGAFTGSNRAGKQGKIELADGGTLFLDEIGDMSFHMQAKLLRFLQEKEVERLGENKVRSVDVRVLAATNQNLLERIKNGQFREDLYYRLQVVQLDLPPLRRRMEDIDVLVRYFIEKYNRVFGKKVCEISEDALRIFKAYDWPGNVRQLENVMERAFNMVETDKILLEHLPHYLVEVLQESNKYRESLSAESLMAPNSMHPLSEAKDMLERQKIIELLRNVHDNKSEAARALGISRVTLYQKIKKYGL